MMKKALSLEKRLDNIFQSTRPHPFFANFMLVVFASLIIGMFARLEIAAGSQSVSLLPLGLLLAGMACGPQRGSYAVIAYLIEGLVGMDVFLGHTWGWRELLGPNAGYLWGGLLAGMIAGLLIARGWGRYVWTSGLAAVIGLIIFHGLGALVALYFIDWSEIVYYQLKPSLKVDLFIILLLACLVPVLWVPLEQD